MNYEKKYQQKANISLRAIMLATIGIVYGDIGTSPLYTLRECFYGQFGFSIIERDIVLGFLSLIFWLLICIVSLKYMTYVMRADDLGEGGILTLMSLASRYIHNRKYTIFLVFIGLMGGGFFYGEVVITPAISVLSAIEGIGIIAPSLNRFIIPLAILILTLLFIMQKQGTYIVSKLFSPIMLLWFIILAVLGIYGIMNNLEVLNAINPYTAVQFFIKYKAGAFFTLGAAVLSITGVEALYSDMGYFGKLPIRLTWFTIVFPSLILNYFGQGALVLKNPEAIKNPFFLLSPKWALIPMLILSTLATIIASQAVISGLFSLTRQAISLGYLPPMRIVHTSEKSSGQIYIPFINWLCYFIVVMIIFSFKHSSNLAGAYGISVTGTMVLTGILCSIVAIKNWRLNRYVSLCLLILMLSIDIPLFLANLVKLFSGGWLPLSLAMIMFFIMNIWRSESLNLLHHMHKNSNALEAMIASLEKFPPIRVSGTAVYMSSSVNVIPCAMLHNLKHNKVLHELVVILTLRIENTPYVHNLNRVTIEQISSTFWRVVVNYGWRETPNIEEVLIRLALEGIKCSMIDTSFFMSNESLIIGDRRWYLRLRGNIFLILQKNSLRTSYQLKLPSNRVIELGSQVII